MDDQRQYQGTDGEEGKTASGLFDVPFPHEFADHSTAAGGKHNANGKKQTDDGVGDIDSRKGVGPHKAGHKKAIDDGVKRKEHHHDDGWQGKEQELFWRKGAGQTLTHNKTS